MLQGVHGFLYLLSGHFSGTGSGRATGEDHKRSHPLCMVRCQLCSSRGPLKASVSTSLFSNHPPLPACLHSFILAVCRFVVVQVTTLITTHPRQGNARIMRANLQFGRLGWQNLESGRRSY